MKPVSGRSIINRKGWVLGICSNCGEYNYVEPHGTTAECRCSEHWQHHDSIPFGMRDKSGMVLMLYGSKLTERKQV